MSQPSTNHPAGSPPPAVAPALLERHEAGLRTYLAGLPGSESVRVEMVIREVMREAVGQLDGEEDVAVWLFTQGRRRIVTGGQRGDVLMADDAEGALDEDVVTTEDPGIAVHRAFARLTIKQQEVLRLKFQFGFNLQELAGITGVSQGGAGGLLHSGMMRVCQASGPAMPLGAEWLRNVRLTAYALDEMEPAEKTAFAESVSDGKALLESSDAIRKTGAHLVRVLESGAPLPKRRRKGAAGWKSPRLILIGAVGVGAAALAWYVARDSGEADLARDDARSGMNGSFATATRARRTEVDGAGRSGDRSDSSGTMARTGRTLRPGEADWERKHFGQSRPRGAGEKSSGEEAANVQTGGETGPVEELGGTRSPGVATAPSEKEAPAAENRGASGAADVAGHPGAEENRVGEDTASLHAGSSESGGYSPSPSGKRAAGRDMQAAKPEATNQAKTESGSGTEAGKAQPVPGPALGVAELRRELVKKKWPKPGEVRVGEMMKQTPPDGTTPAGAADEPLASEVEVARSPWNPDKVLVRVAVKAKQAPVPARPPANLVFAIDVSQSMAGPNRLPLVQEGIRLLAQRLRPEDRVTVVTYAASAKEALPGIPVGGKALELRNCLGGLEAAGQTNGYEGLQLAYAAARRGQVESGLNVVVLCTDGNFNLGETDETVLADMAAQAAAEGIKLSVFGFGRSDRNDLRLELLAAKGGGRSCYVNTREEAERLLATQIDGLFEAVAQEVALTVKFNPERVAESGRIDGGQEGATSAAVAELLPGRSLEAWYEVSWRAGSNGTDYLATLDVNFRLPGLPAGQSMKVRLEGEVQDWAQTDPGFRFAVAWAEFGRILQGERTQAADELDRLEAWVQRYLPEDGGGYRIELLENLAAARAAAGEVGR